MTTYEQFQRIQNAAIKKSRCEEAASRIEDARLYDKYSEPGYGSENTKGVVLGNYNRVDFNKTEEDTSPMLFGELLEKAGFEIEWEDEWVSCDDCGGVIRCEADCAFWTRSYYIHDEKTTCFECMDPKEYIGSLIGNPKTALLPNSGIDLSEHGYFLAISDLERGMHSGQNASPEEISEQLQNLGVDDYLFAIDGVTPYEVDFCLWVSDQFKDRANEIQHINTDRGNPSENLRRALQSIPVVSAANSGQALHHKINIETGEVSTEVIDFRAPTDRRVDD